MSDALVLICFVVICFFPQNDNSSKMCHHKIGFWLPAQRQWSLRILDFSENHVRPEGEMEMFWKISEKKKFPQNKWWICWHVWFWFVSGGAGCTFSFLVSNDPDTKPTTFHVLMLHANKDEQKSNSVNTKKSCTITFMASHLTQPLNISLPVCLHNQRITTNLSMCPPPF